MCQREAALVSRVDPRLVRRHKSDHRGWISSQSAPPHPNSLGTVESFTSPFLLLPFLFTPSIIPHSFPPDSPPLGSASPVAFSSLFGAAFLFPASNPRKMLSLSPSNSYKQTLTSCFSEPWRRHKGPFLHVHPLLAKNCSAFGVFF